MIEKLIYEDGSVSHIGSFLCGRDDRIDRSPFVSIWGLGVLLSPAIELAINVWAPTSTPSLHWLVGPLVIFVFGVFGSFLGMKLSLVFMAIFHDLFRLKEGRAWDAAFIVVFLLARTAGIWLLKQPSPLIQ